MNAWIGVDLDGTLAHYEDFKGPEQIGEPIPLMVERVKLWLTEGREVRIFTARVWPLGTAEDRLDSLNVGNPRLVDAFKARSAIEKWCLKHLGTVLPVTCTKDYGMLELWDDRAVQVKINTGEPVGFSTRGHK
jgi:hypothetical protein